MIWHIRERSAFRRLTAEGRRVRAGALWCTYLLDPSASPPRVAFALGRPLGPAVVRNRVRRRLRMLIRAACLPPGWYLVGSSPAIVEQPFASIQADVDDLRARITKERPRNERVCGESDQSATTQSWPGSRGSCA